MIWIYVKYPLALFTLRSRGDILIRCALLFITSQFVQEKLHTIPCSISLHTVETLHSEFNVKNETGLLKVILKNQAIFVSRNIVHLCILIFKNSSTFSFLKTASVGRYGTLCLSNLHKGQIKVCVASTWLLESFFQSPDHHCEGGIVTSSERFF